MNAVSSKTFKSGNSVAVRLPKEIAFPPDTRVVVERSGDVLTIRPATDPAEEKRKVLALVESLRALGRSARSRIGADRVPDRAAL